MKISKSKNYFITIFLSITLLTLVPVVVFSAISYAVTAKNIRESLKEQTYVDQKKIMGSISANIDRMSKENLSISQNEKIRDFIDLSNGYYLERVSGPYKNEDLQNIFRYLMAKQKAAIELSLAKSGNSMINSIYLYDADKQLILNDSGQSYYLNDFAGDDFWQGIFNGKLTVLSKTVFGGQKCISVCYPIYEKGYIVLNVDEKALYQSLYESTYKDIKGSAFAVVGKDLTTIYYNGNSELDNVMEPLKSKIQKNGEPELSFLDEKGSIYISAALYEPISCYFVSLVDFKAISERYLSFSKITLTLSILALILLGIASYFLSKRLYRPIDALSKDLTGGGLNSRELIYSDFSAIIEKYSALNLKYEETYPVYKERFFQKLLSGSISEEKLSEMASYFKLKRFENGYLVIVLQMLSNPESLIDANIKLRENCADLIKKNDGEYIEVNSNLTAVIYVCHNQDAQAATKFIEGIANIVADTDLEVEIGSSRVKSDIIQMPKAFEEATDSVKARAIDAAMANGDANRPIILDFIEGIERFENMLSNMQTDAALKKYDEITEHLLQKPTADENKSFVLVRIYESILKLCDRIGLAVSELQDSGTDFYDVVKHSDIDYSVRTLRNIIKQMSEVFEGSSDHKVIVSKAIEYIAGNSVSAISLEVVADSIGVSASHLSKTFKAVTGSNFSDYVVLHKVNEAKKLLKDSKLTIAQISERVGYSQCSYFIKVFKYVTGTTPGSFRNINQK